MFVAKPWVPAPAPLVARCVGAMFLIGLLLAAVPARASDARLVTAVTSVPGTVSVSRPGLDAYFSYDVSITNQGRSTVNNIRFEVPLTAASYVEALGASCSVNAPASKIVCNIGQLRGGVGASARFSLVYKSPAAGSQVDAAWTTYYGEGSDDDHHAQHDDTNRGTVSTTLVTNTDAEITKSVKSLITTRGGTLFTGLYTPAGAAATPSDPWTTTIAIPAIEQLATAEIAEVESPVTCAPDVQTCNTSAITIPGVVADLVFTLRRDKTTIAKGANILSSTITYDNPQHPDPRITYPLTVPACTDTTWGLLPQPGIPCVDSRRAYAAKNKPGKPYVPPGFECDWEFVIRARDNGSYRN